MAFAAALMENRPKLVLFARRLCQDVDRAEDLASETVARGWRFRDHFEVGTNLSAWLTFILRNLFLSEQRRKRWDGGFIEDHEGFEVPISPSQEDHMHLLDLERALDLIPPEQREAVLAVAMNGDYEDAAHAMNVPVGTAKTRIARGRQALRDLSE